MSSYERIDFAKKILDGATATGAGSTYEPMSKDRVFQATGLTSSGSGAASIDVEVSLDGSNWDVMGTISLTLGTTSTSDSFASTTPWKYVRGNVTSISGTGATVYLWCGVD